MITTHTNRQRLACILLSLGLVLGLACLALAGSSAPRLSVTDFGAIPDDDRDDTPALRAALNRCRDLPGATLVLPPGTYRLRDEKAVELMNDVMTGKIPGNPQPTIFQPYYPYVKFLDFTGVSDLTIEATGACLMVEGWGEPISLSHCRNITIKGLTIDYNRKPNTVGFITEVHPEWFEAECDPIYTLNPGMSLCHLTIWDPVTRRYLKGGAGLPKFEVINKDTIRIFLSLSPEMRGKFVTILHTFHFRPAIFLFESSNIVLEDVNVHAQPGMGIVGHRSSDLTFRGLRVVPRAGQLISSNTDATHFTSCAGTITFENCQFEGQGDDATNIHNYYHTIEKSSSSKSYYLRLVQADWHAGLLDYPDVGDTLELVHRSTLAVAKTVRVTAVALDISGLRTKVGLSEELPPDLDHYYLINATRLPRVRIIGCTVSANRCRGFLIKTRDVLIERCLLRETEGTGIHVGAEGGWHEGPTSAHVVIRNNRFIRCGGGAGTIDGWAIAVKVDAPDDTVPGLHRNIFIEGNIIELENAKTGISIQGAADVTVRANEIAGCETPIKVTHSTDVRIEANPGIPNRYIKE